MQLFTDIIQEGIILGVLFSMHFDLFEYKKMIRHLRVQNYFEIILGA